MARNRKANLVGTITATSLNVESIILVSGQDVSGQANNAYAQANAAYSQANSAYTQGNSAYSQANNAYSQANSAYGQANSSYSQANSAYAQANTATTNAANAHSQANDAYSQANSAYADSNTRVLKTGDTMTGQLNISSGGLLVTGNSNFDSGTLFVNSVANRVGVGTTNPQNDLDVASSGSYSVVSARNLGADGRSELRAEANNGQQILLNAINYAGIAETITNATGGYYIGTETTAPLIFRTNNTEQVRIISSGNVGIKTDNPTSNLHVVGNANITLGIVTGAGINAATVNATTVNASTLLTNSGINVSAQAADAYSQANSSYSQANSGYTQANSAYAQANLAYTQANTAFTAANNSNLKLGGVITGTLNVTNDIIVGGNVYLQGNTTYINVSTYQINDALMYIAANNTLTDSVDIGFVGAKNTSGVFSHTGFARDATDGKYKLFDNLPDSGHVGNVIDFANTSLATLVANVEASSILLSGNAVATNISVNAAYTQANNAYNQSNSAYTQANSAYGQANLAYTQANNAYGAANNRVLKAGDTMTGQLNISSGGLLVTGNVDIDSGTLFVDAVNDKVGINTSTPGYRLTVAGSSGTAALSLVESGVRTWTIDAGGQSTNTFRIADITAGSARLLIDSSGNIGIGTTSPRGKLEVSGNTFIGNTFYVDTTNECVGIGTTEPSSFAGWLTVDGGINIRRFGADALWIHSDNNNAYIEDLRNAKVHIMINSAERFTFSNNWYLGLNTTSPQASIHIRHPDPRIRLEDQNGGDNIDLFAEYGAGGTEFKIRNSTLSRTDLTINGSGNVGIGTTSPTRKLDVIGDSNSGIRLKQGAQIANALAANTFYNGLVFENTSTTHAWSIGYNQGAAFSINWFDADANTFSNRFFISSGGNVGIGTASPSQKLDVYGYTTTSRIAVRSSAHVSSGFLGGRSDWVGGSQDDNFAIGSYQSAMCFFTNNSATERMRIDSSGNIGIGTTSPASLLNLHAAAPDLIVNGTDAASTYGVKIRYNGSTTHGLHLTYYPNSAVSYIDNTYQVSAGTVYGDIYFRHNVAGTMTTCMTLKADGSNVGIGTTSPAGKLDIRGDNNQLFLTTTGTYASLYTLHSGVNTGALYWNSSGSVFLEARGASGSMFFSAGGTGTTKMTILSGGNVGIGTTSPTAKLHVTAAATTAASLTWGAAAGQILRNEDSELAIGLSSSSPYPLYLQGRTNANIERAIVLNPLGGNVGIGTTSPSNKLHVVGNYTLQNGDMSLTQNYGITWNNGDNYIKGISGYHLQFTTYDGVSAQQEVMRITGGSTASGGARVGIGTTSPSGKLHLYNSGDSLLYIEGGAGYEAGIWFRENGVNKWEIYKRANPDDLNFYSSDLTASVMTLAAAGGVGIGTLTPGSYKLYVQGDQYISGTLTEASSIVLKENIDPISNALDTISKLVGVTYDRKDGSAKNRAGLIAEEVEQVLPNVVNKDEEGNPTGIQYTNLIAYLIESIKELKAEIDVLKSK